MTQDWLTLTKLTGGAPCHIERVRLTDSHVAIEGTFELPPLARLATEDQVFVAAFVRSHGSIKEMEKLFGVSYPTIKNRLNRIGLALPSGVEVHEPAPDKASLLDRLERGEMTVGEVLERLGTRANRAPVEKTPAEKKESHDD